MYVATVPNRDSPPAVLLREGYREGAKVKNRTIANLSHWPAHKIEALRAALRGDTAPAALGQAFDIVRCAPRPRGGGARHASPTRPGLAVAPRLPPPRPVWAMVARRVIDPAPSWPGPSPPSQTLSNSLAHVLGVTDVDEDELYAAMDWLLRAPGAHRDGARQASPTEGDLVLYDVTSTYFEGHSCPLAKLGHSRDGKRDKLQIVFGLLTDGEAVRSRSRCSRATPAIPRRWLPRSQKLRERFGLERVVLVGDRGMITEARIREDLRRTRRARLDHGAASPADPGAGRRRRAAAVALRRAGPGRDPASRLSRASGWSSAAIRCWPRSVRANAQELLAATEKTIGEIVAAATRRKRPLRGKRKIGLRVGKVLGRYKMAKHFQLRHRRRQLSLRAQPARIEREGGARRHLRDPHQRAGAST